MLDQDFAAERPDQKWGADISYIWTAAGWLYPAVIVDLFSRRIVGWATSDRMKKDLELLVDHKIVASSPRHASSTKEEAGTQGFRPKSNR